MPTLSYFYSSFPTLVRSFTPSARLPWQPSSLSWTPTALFSVVTGEPEKLDVSTGGCTCSAFLPDAPPTVPLCRLQGRQPGGHPSLMFRSIIPRNISGWWSSDRDVSLPLPAACKDLYSPTLCSQFYCCCAYGMSPRGLCMAGTSISLSQA